MRSSSTPARVCCAVGMVNAWKLGLAPSLVSVLLVTRGISVGRNYPQPPPHWDYPLLPLHPELPLCLEIPQVLIESFPSIRNSGVRVVTVVRSEEGGDSGEGVRRMVTVVRSEEDGDSGEE